MKPGIIFSIALLGAASAWSQTPSSPPPDSVISSPRTSAATATTPEAGGLTFTNQNGQAVSVGELDSQLENLRVAVERTLPMLQAFNSHVGSSSTTETIANAIGRIFHRGGANQTQAGNTSTSSTATNLLGVLRGLFTTNANNSLTLNPTTVSELQKLQSDLEPVASLLQSMNLNAAGTNAPSGNIGYNPQTTTNQYRTVPTPTGR